ncbi:MAG TPA: TIGR03086 family protein, partial [Pseudonocardia sp.]|nr:TIGR03086 family protein [Pseudonocardia sp.]
YGTDRATSYGWQMTLDLAVHGWDLASGIDVGYRIPAELATDLLDVFTPQIAQWQGVGLFDPPVPVPVDADPHTRLLALLGRKP